MIRRKLVAAITLALGSGTGGLVSQTVFGAEPSPGCHLVSAGSATVKTIVDGDTVILGNGYQVRLVGIQAPKLPLGRKNYPTWPLAPEAKAALSDLTLGKTVELRYGGEREDRHGRRLAHLFVGEEKTWVQGEMVGQGLARTYSFYDNRSCVRKLQERESAARNDSLGIWDLKYYRLRQAADIEELLSLLNSFQLIEGRVTETAMVRGRVFLNFGKNYRDDFTAVISPKDMRRFRDGPIDPMALKGKKIRVRGWLESHNGPSIDVTHPEQIEFLR